MTNKNLDFQTITFNTTDNEEVTGADVTTRTVQSRET